MSIIEILGFEKYKNYSKLYTVNIIKMNNYGIDLKIY
jgi:hypothetical protein